MGKKIRSFVAISLPDFVLRVIARAQDTLRRSDFDIRWVRTEGIHLTLKFLGDIEEERVAHVGGAVERAAAGVGPFSLCGKGIGVFPDLRRPRVVWAGIGGDVAVLSSLQQRLEGELSKLGFPEEGRPFQGHLTLGRVKGRLDKARFGEALRGVEGIESELFRVQSITVFQSTLKPQGAIYDKLVDVVLKD